MPVEVTSRLTVDQMPCLTNQEKVASATKDGTVIAIPGKDYFQEKLAVSTAQNIKEYSSRTHGFANQ